MPPSSSPGRCAARARRRARRSRSTARGRSCTPRPPRPCSAPRPGAIRFDAPAAGNRPGRHGIWQRPVERRRMRDAPLLVPWSEGGLAEAPRPHADAVVVPVPVEPSGPAGGRATRRDHLRREPGEEGPRPRARRVGGGSARRRGAGRRRPRRGGAGEWAEAAPRGARRTACGSRGCSRARTTGRCCGARGCSCAPRGGRTTGSRSWRRWPTGACSSPTPRRGRTRRCRSRGELDSRLVGGIAEGIRTALDDPRAGYAARASELLAPWRPRGGRRGGARAAAAAVSLAGMTPISGQSVLITGAAHGIGAETARRLAARGARVSLVGLGDLEAVAADCPGSITFEADVTDRDALDAAVRRHRRGVRRHRHACSPTPASARRASSAAWTRRCSSASSRST